MNPGAVLPGFFLCRGFALILWNNFCSTLICQFFKLIYQEMKRVKNHIITAIILLLLVTACRKKDVPPDDTNKIPADIIATNEWIFETMSLYYYWNNLIPVNIDLTLESDPEVYFTKLIYKDKDKWSYITDDYASLSAELSGDPVTMGYHPAFYLAGQDNVIIVVCYVYPGSPAEEAGLKRGDIILSINNTLLDRTNYYTLFSGTNYSVQLGAVVNNALTFTDKSLNLVARVTETNPAIHHEVLDIDGVKIGYLAYVEFLSGKNNMFLPVLDNIFNEFKNEGISELIVDLRYNPGGDIGAVLHLASEIAPFNITLNRETLVQLKYNYELQRYLEFNNYSDYLYYKLKTVSSNINMNRVYVLTTSRSASASELLIIGLKTYLDVVQIGEPTYGKYAGSWVIPDDTEKWAMMPIVMKFANIQGFTDFENGLIPDHEIDDDPVGAVPFGDITDPMVAKAIELATGVTTSPKKSRATEVIRLEQIFPPEMSIKKSLIMNTPGF